MTLAVLVGSDIIHLWMSCVRWRNGMMPTLKFLMIVYGFIWIEANFEQADIVTEGS
jgi:hypothetical protein